MEFGDVIKKGTLTFSEIHEAFPFVEKNESMSDPVPGWPATRRSRFGVSWRRQRAQVQSGGRDSACGLGSSVRACLCLVTLVLAYARLADMQALLLVRVSAARRNGSTSDMHCPRRFHSDVLQILVPATVPAYLQASHKPEQE